MVWVAVVNPHLKTIPDPLRDVWDEGLVRVLTRVVTPCVALKWSSDARQIGADV